MRYIAERNLRKLPGFGGFLCDVLAPDADLQKEVRKAVELWRKNSIPPSRTGSEILIGADGKVLEADLLQLTRQRDDRPVTIKE